MYRNTGRVYLSEARISKICTFLKALPSGRTIAIHSIGRKIICMAVTTCGEYDCMCSESFNFACNQITSDNTFCLTVDNNKIQHLVTWITCYSSSCNLTVKSSISSQKKLLSCLPASIERTTYLHTTERTVCKISAIFPCERNALSYALVNDFGTDLGKTI